MSDSISSRSTPIADPSPARSRDIVRAPDRLTGRRLPTQLTRLVGREHALTDLRALVWRGRMLTLCGPGGAGKTRLAIALAEAVEQDFVEGAWWVDLSATFDPDSVAHVIAGTVAQGARDDSSPAALARRFADSSLLVLDNCEQLGYGCAEVLTELLAAAQSLRVIATSREPLGVPGEQVWRVPGLLVGDVAACTPNTDQAGAAAELFLERARESASRFDPERPGVRDAVARICRWLDGMPLAIELAAAQVPVLSVAEIAERLERGLGSPRHAGRVAPARHRTFRANVEWSHRLLAPDEQRLFRRLGAFRGSFSLAGAEAIGADGALGADAVLGVLSALVACSLVQVVDDRGSLRYRLLAATRHYAADKLEQSGESPATRQRHASHFRQLALDAEPERIELEHENLTEALRWLLANSATDAAELVFSLWPAWRRRGYYQEARLAFEQILVSGHEIPPAVRAEALRGAGEAALLQCDYPVASEHLRRALGLSRDLGDRTGSARSLQRLGSIAQAQGDFDQARNLHLQSLAIWTELGDRCGIAASQNDLGFGAWLAGDHEASASPCSGALTEFRRAGRLQDVVGALVNLGASALYRDQLELAADRLEEALLIARELGYREGIACSQHMLAVLARRRRRPLRERTPMLRDALLVHSQLGDRRRVASVLEEISGSLLLRLDPVLAVELLAHAELIREQLRTPIPPIEAPEHAAIRARPGASLIDSAWSRGRDLQLEITVERAVQAIDQLEHGAEASAQRSAPILTPREVAVLGLVTDGQTNRAIAAALHISASTAGVHVSNILRKLGARRRVDAAGLAHALGLLATG